MDLSIITVNTNSGTGLLAQIASVKKGAVGLEYEQIISDNGSVDNSAQSAKSTYPEIKIILNNKNIGFGRANNAAAKKSTGRYLLFLNPDMRVMPKSLKTLVDWMDKNSSVGIAGCKLVDEKGGVSVDALPRRFPKVFDQVVVLLKLHHLFPSLIRNYLCHDMNHDKTQKVDSVRGSFFLMRRELYEKLGWAFDPRYFIWFEDVDTCREAYRLGYDVFYTPIISCVDYVGQTFKTLPSLQKQKWFTASMLEYFKKWEAYHKWMVIAVLRPVAICMAWVKEKTILKFTKA